VLVEKKTLERVEREFTYMHIQ